MSCKVLASLQERKEWLLLCFLTVCVGSTVPSEVHPLGLLVPGRPVRGAVPDGQQVIVPGNVTVPGQVIGALKVAGTPAAGVLDYADSGLNFVDVFIGC